MERTTGEHDETPNMEDRTMIMPNGESSSTTEKKAVSHDFFTKEELQFFEGCLLSLRDRIIDDISFHASDNLNRSRNDVSGELSHYSYHMADHGTDSFDQELALSMVSNEQDALYEINDALERIKRGTYGICEVSGEPIDKERLKVMPHARCSVEAQAEIEGKQPRQKPWRNA